MNNDFSMFITSLESLSKKPKFSSEYIIAMCYLGIFGPVDTTMDTTLKAKLQQISSGPNKVKEKKQLSP